MTYRFRTDLKWSDATPKEAFLNRRQIMTGAAAMAAGTMIGGMPGAAQAQQFGVPIEREANSLDDITSYNNYYEFGTGKGDPKENAGDMVTDPWAIQVSGMVDNPGNYSVADLTDGLDVHDRLYRFRCVEAWSMVIPWNGVQLGDVLKKVGVQSGAKYVSFKTAVKPDVMPGVSFPVLDWPYREGLRLDEAMHPLTLLATGIYDEPLYNQNGAPIRLVVPWKYGFKSIKSIVNITLTDELPDTSWNLANAREYGFYSNVNPEVDHPRWSQATERPIGGGLFARRIETLMFNGYADEVASLYEGMDLSVDI